MGTLKECYDNHFGDDGLTSDFAAMVAWLDLIDALPSLINGDTPNESAIKGWVLYRKALQDHYVMIASKYPRDELIDRVMENCDPLDTQAITERADKFTNGDLLALARVFDVIIDGTLEEFVEESRRITISWHVDDVKHVRADLTEVQALEVLQLAKHRHDATIGISWEVLESHANSLFPVVHINHDEWVELYKPLLNTLVGNASFDGFLFETYGKELDYVKSKSPEFVWTLVEDDDGEPCIVNGFHHANRLGYFVCKKQCDTNTIVSLQDD